MCIAVFQKASKIMPPSNNIPFNIFTGYDSMTKALSLTVCVQNTLRIKHPPDKTSSGEKYLFFIFCRCGGQRCVGRRCGVFLSSERSSSRRRRRELCESANEVSQDAAEGGRLARRVSCVTKSNWLAVRREYRRVSPLRLVCYG